MMQKPAVRIILAILVFLVFLGACVLGPVFYDFNLGASENDDEDGGSTITVAAASDLIPAFREIGERYDAETDHEVEFSFGSSGMLAQQVESGAPIDVYVSANQDYVRQLDEQGLLIKESVQRYARGRLVLWSLDEQFGSIEDLDDLRDPAIERVAIGNPDHAPYGIAGREALQSTGVWNDLQDRLVLGANIRETMQYAETGNVDVAIVALSLATEADEGSWTLLPADLHEPIDQTLGIVADTEHEDAARVFVEYVTGEEGRRTLEQYGFEFPDEAGE